jgi:uncharacterized repeat protein (TIGR01451 family)
MNREDPRKLIIELLKKHPEGLTIASISAMTSLHRHTCTKYIHELIGAGAIIQRNVGVAKLCYLENKISENEEKKLLEKLERRRSAEKYSLKVIFSVVLITFLLSEATILAYENSSLNQTFYDNISNTSPLTSSLTLNDSNITQIIETAIENASNSSVEINDSLVPVEIIENMTNDTNILNETPLESSSKFDISFDYPQKITRGEEFRIKAYITNTGSYVAKNIVVNWQLPEGFEIISKSESCENLEPDSNCASEITVKSAVIAALGKNDLKVVVNYEE